MKYKLLTLVSFFLVTTIGQAQTIVNVNITGRIDGLSDILISPTGFQWKHFEAQAPGLEAGIFPTNITVTVGGNTALNASWFPDWTPPTVLPGGSEPIFSSLYSYNFTGTANYIPDSDGLSILQSRGSVTLLQTPNGSDGNTFDVQFNDIFTPGSTDYQISLTYSVSSVPEPGFYGVIFGLAGLALTIYFRSRKN